MRTPARRPLHLGASLTWLLLLPGLCSGQTRELEVAEDSDPARTRATSRQAVPPALFEFIGEFSDSEAGWTDPTELDEWMLPPLQDSDDPLQQTPNDPEQDTEPDE